jgi:hypothetical protein
MELVTDYDWPSFPERLTKSLLDLKCRAQDYKKHGRGPDPRPRLDERKDEAKTMVLSPERTMVRELRHLLADILERRGKRERGELRYRELTVFKHLAARIAEADRRKAEADRRKAEADRRKAEADRRKAEADRRTAPRSIPERWTYVNDWQVCELCDRVFKASQQNARRCQTCRRSKRPVIVPVRYGGRHTSLWEDADGSVVYFVLCECGDRFGTMDVQQSLCQSCGSNVGRQRRRRGSSPDPLPTTGFREAVVDLDLEPS